MRRYLPSLIERSSPVAIFILTLDRPKPSRAATSAGEYHRGASGPGWLLIAISLKDVGTVDTYVSELGGVSDGVTGVPVAFAGGGCGGVGEQGVTGVAPARAGVGEGVDHDG